MKKTIIFGLFALMLLTGCTQLSNAYNQSFGKQQPQPVAPPPPVVVVNTTTNQTNTTNETVGPSLPQFINPPRHIGNLTAYYIDVGQADSILLVGPNNGTLLIDCGSKNAGPKIAEVLHNLGFMKIDALVVSHLHEDHIGGCADVIVKLKPKMIYDNGRTVDSEAFRNYKSAFSSQNTYEKVGLDKPFVFDSGAAANLIVPYDDRNGFSPEENDNSILVRVQDGYKSFLFTGDCGPDCEPRVLDSDVQADILKVGHHGSKTSSSTLFLQRVLPSIAVISVGSGNSYGHPSAEALERLSGTSVYRTDELGTVIVTTDGKGVGVEEMR